MSEGHVCRNDGKGYCPDCGDPYMDRSTATRESEGTTPMSSEPTKEEMEKAQHWLDAFYLKYPQPVNLALLLHQHAEEAVKAHSEEAAKAMRALNDSWREVVWVKEAEIDREREAREKAEEAATSLSLKLGATERRALDLVAQLNQAREVLGFQEGQLAASRAHLDALRHELAQERGLLDHQQTQIEGLLSILERGSGAQE